MGLTKRRISPTCSGTCPDFWIKLLTVEMSPVVASFSESVWETSSDHRACASWTTATKGGHKRA